MVHRFRICGDRPGSVFSHFVPQEDDLDCLEEDAEIKPERHVLDVVQVVPQLLDLFIQVRCVPIANLCPSRDPRPYHRAEGIVRNRLAALGSISRDQDQEFKLGNTLRSRTHQGHVTLEDIQELGKLIKPELPEPSSNPRDMIMVVLEPESCIPVVRVHGSKLDQFEALTGHAHTILDAEYRTTRIELDRQSNQSEQGGKADHTDHRHQEADPLCDGQMETGLSEVLFVDMFAPGYPASGLWSTRPRRCASEDQRSGG